MPCRQRVELNLVDKGDGHNKAEARDQPLTARAPGHSDLPKKIFLDLVEANRQQLLAAGVPAKSIETSPLCTNCRPDLLFSYRAEKGKTGRQMAVAGIRE